MIRFLVKLGHWLDSRFPEKVVVTTASFEILVKDLRAVQTRLDRMEKEAVHKDAVKDLVLVVKSVKDDFQSLKTSLGFNTRQANPELNAVLNGEYLQGDPNERI